MLAAIARYVHIDDGPGVALDDLKRIVLELGMVADGITNTRRTLRSMMPAAAKVQREAEDYLPPLED